MPLTDERGQLCDPLPLGERLLGDEGEVHGGDDAGRRADPQDVLARQQRRDAQARRLVLADYVVAPWKQPVVDLLKNLTMNRENPKIPRNTDYDLPERTLLTTPDTFTSAMHSRLTT